MSETVLTSVCTHEDLEKLVADSKRLMAGEDILGDWLEPEPLAETLPEVMPFDLELMPESLRPLVKDVAERMQVPLDFPAVAAIATLAGVTNRRAMIQPKRNDHTWVVVPNLWGGIVAPPGTRKSPAISCMTQPARAIERVWREEYLAAEKDYKAAQELHEARLKAWTAQMQSALKKNAELPSKPESMLNPPSLRRLITGDATYESLQHLLSENPAGLFVVRDELTGWLVGLEKQGREGERAFYLESWNGDLPFTIDRVGRGNVHVPHNCMSIFGGIQPARLRAYFADALRDGATNDGLIQRFQLLIWPDVPPASGYIDRVPDTSAIQRATVIYERITALDEQNPLLLKFDDAAQALFAEWLTELDRRILGQDLSPAMQAHLAKYRKLMPSLALLFALADGHTEKVPLAYAQLACDWCEYLETHAGRVYASQARPEYHAAIELSRKLARGWKRAEGKFTLREVYRNGWTGLDSPETVRKALQVLEEYGWVRLEGLEDARLAGRPTEQYLRNPRIEAKHAR